MSSDSAKKEFYTKLIAQGLLMLVESDVQVCCRAADDKIVESCFSDAVGQYSKVIQAETGANKSCKLTLDKANKLAPSCIGGITLSCQNSTITIDNTIDSRLGLVLEQAKPTIRKLLFPS